MQLLSKIFIPLIMMVFPWAALAHGCPGEMALIDRALAAKPKMDDATLKKIRELRAEAEKLHKNDQHGESMLVLGSAKRLLGLQ
jgi:hypothetical protein